MNNMLTHEQLVRSLAKPGAQIAYDLQPGEAHLLHMACGVCTEAGEVVDIIKKAVIYHKPLDRDHLIEELGDLMFYIEGICQEIGVSKGEVLANNINKLTTRYGSEYSDQAAIERVDTVVS